MSPKKQLEISNYCYAMVSGMFANFQRPEMRGENFTWKNFPQMCADLASTQVFLGVKMNKNNSAEITVKATEYATEIATTLCKHANYL